MKFTATTTFLDGNNRYEEGKPYDEPPALVTYFVRCGWADAPGLKSVPQPQDVTLDIDPSTVGVKSQKMGRR